MEIIQVRVEKFKSRWRKARLGFFGHLYRHPDTPPGSLLRRRLAADDCPSLLRTLREAGLGIDDSLSREGWREALEYL